MKNIVLLNYYGKKNIGDEAIHQTALILIDKAVKEKYNLYSICVDTNTSASDKGLEKQVIKIRSPYGFSINQGGRKLNIFEKCWHFLLIILGSLFFAILGYFTISLLPKKGIFSYIWAIKQSDVVINIGGGYLRTKNKFADYFGLLTTVLPIFISKLYKKPMTFLPMSFGNFASSNHENIAFQSLTRSTFFARDKLTLERIKRHEGFEKANIEIEFMPDLALLHPWKKSKVKKTKKGDSYIVLSARKWLSAKEQHKYEFALAKAVSYVYSKYKLTTKFVAMASNSIEDDDLQVASEINKLINNPQKFSVSPVSTPQEVLKLMGGAKMSICTRMHSAILSSVVLTPFTTIQYEPKTLGFMQSLSLSEFNTPIEKVNFNDLKKQIDKILGNKNRYRNIQAILLQKRKINMKYEKNLVEKIKTITSN